MVCCRCCFPQFPLRRLWRCVIHWNCGGQPPTACTGTCCAWDRFGRARCWGSNGFGQLGTGDLLDGCSTPEEPDLERQPLDKLAFMPEELTVLSLPEAPDASLSHTDVVEAVCRGLQHPDVPSAKAGQMRLYNFCTYDCKVCRTP